MSMLDALKQVKEENFDPSKGKTTEPMGLPEGTYNVILKEVVHGVWKNSQTDYIRFTMQVLDGEQAGRQEFITPTLAQKTSKGKDMPVFVLAQSIKTIKVIGAMVGCEVPDDIFAKENESEAYEALEKLFQDYLGKALVMKLTLSKNKKDPDNPYRNYEFAKMEQPKAAEVDEKKDPFEGAKGSDEEITNEDLPFDLN